ncbi:hypothetical protein SCFA_750008 [anaerobic digester metagenome]|uniref:Uncharacterized protein n=1 Tax=anaerobic digester metagenome TaxID=1263854 RepID=A0A485M464_9ZZZZ
MRPLRPRGISRRGQLADHLLPRGETILTTENLIPAGEGPIFGVRREGRIPIGAPLKAAARLNRRIGYLHLKSITDSIQTMVFSGITLHHNDESRQRKKNRQEPDSECFFP